MKQSKSLKAFFYERRTSFTFTIGSIAYGIYHFCYPHIISTSQAYETANAVLGAIGGRYFGIVFVVLGSIKLYGILTNNIRIRLSAYFALTFSWLLLSLCFFIAFLSGNLNAAWLYILMLIGMSSNIVEKPFMFKDKFNE